MNFTEGTVYTADSVMRAIEGLVKLTGSQKEAAKTLGVSPQYLSDILRGRREISDVVARRLGFNREVVFTATSSFSLKGMDREVNRS